MSATEKKRVRVLLVDDSEVVRMGLRSLLGGQPAIEIAGEAGNVAAAVETCGRLRPDVITIEVEQLGHAFEDVLGALTEACPAAAIVALSSDADVEHAVLAARAGVPAWVPKDSTADELAAVLRGVCQGQAWYPPRFLGPVLRGLLADVRRARDHSGPLDGLSKADAAYDEWIKEVAPSTDLRRWFGHDPARFEEFAERYRAELEGSDALARLRAVRDEHPVVTLLYGARDTEHNQAVVLRGLLG